MSDDSAQAGNPARLQSREITQTPENQDYSIESAGFEEPYPDFSWERSSPRDYEAIEQYLTSAEEMQHSKSPPTFTTIQVAKLTAANAFLSLFKSTAFSGFEVMDYLLRKASATWDEFLGHAKVLKERLNLKNDLKEMFGDFDVNQTSMGGCTVLTVQLTRLVENSIPADFEYFSVGKHTLARDKVTGLVIDSSSVSGPFVVREEEEVAELLHPKQLRLYFSKGTISTSFVDRAGKTKQVRLRNVTKNNES